MSEADLWGRVRTGLSPFGRLYRVENAVGDGMPDVHYLLHRRPAERAVYGWLELKYEPEWPVRADTPVTLTKLTLGQVTWHQEHVAAGGRAWTLAQISRSLVLMDCPTLALVHRRLLTRAALIARASAFDPHGLAVGPVVKWLTA